MAKCKLVVYLSVFGIFLFCGIYFSGIHQSPCIFESYIHNNPYEEMSYEMSETEKTGLININTASVSELSALPGIGEKLSQRIIRFRNEKGNFEVIEDILKVPGIGDKKFNTIKPYITVK